MINTDELTQWTDFLCRLHGQHGGRTEVRTITCPLVGNKSIINSRIYGDPEPLVSAIKNMHEARPEIMERTNLYTTLNPVDRDFQPNAGGAIPDSAITAFLWLPVDIDPVRYDKDSFGVPQAMLDQKLPTTNEELENAGKAAEIIEAMIETATGKRATVSAISGNGHHKLFRVDGDKMVMKDKCHQILKTLKQIFTVTPLSSHWVGVDTSVCNPARIWKLYGTVAKKWGKEGLSDTPTRPFRMSSIISLREEEPLTACDLDKLQTSLNDYLARFVKEAPPRATQPTGPAPALASNTKSEDWLKDLGGVDLMTLDVASALTEAGHQILNEGTVEYRHNDGTLENKSAVWIKCPNAHNHSSSDGEKDAVVYLPKLNSSGTRVFAGFDCFHDHCKHLTGSEALHMQIIGKDIVRKNCEAGNSAPTPIAAPTTETGFTPPPRDENAPEVPKEIRVNRKNIRSMDWMLDHVNENPREELIPGLLLRGEVMTMAAPSKVGKTYQLMHACIAWCNGLPFLGMHAIRPLRILFLDPELLEDQAQIRMSTLAINIVDGRPANTLDYINLRYDPVMAADDPWGAVMASLSEWLGSGDDWDIIVVDSMYKFQGTTNLNDASAVNRMLLKLKVVTGSGSQPAIIYVHHFAKGDPGLKKTGDRSVGSFVFTADADVLMTLTPHPLTETSGVDHYNVEFTRRHGAKPPTYVVRRRADLPILDPVDEAPQIDSAYMAKRRTAMECCMILEETIQMMVCRATPYEKVQVTVKEWRDTSCAKLHLTPEMFESARKIADTEEWVKGIGHGKGRFYNLTESGDTMVKEARCSGNYEYIFGKAEAPAPAPNDTPKDEAPAAVVTNGNAGRGLV